MARSIPARQASRCCPEGIAAASRRRRVRAASFSFGRHRIVQDECDQEERGSKQAECFKVKHHCPSRSSTQDKGDPNVTEKAYFEIWSYYNWRNRIGSVFFSFRRD